METLFRGRVWKLGDDINTDLLYPGFARGMEWEELRPHILHTHPRFNKEVQPGDVIVAGRNFGCGSGRPVLEYIIKLGVSCIVADSFARLFFRNSITQPYPVFSCEGVSAMFEEGDELELDMLEARVKNLTTGKELVGKPLAKEMWDIINAGGMKKTLQMEKEAGRLPWQL